MTQKYSQYNTIGIHDHLRPSPELPNKYSWSFFAEAFHCCRILLFQFVDFVLIVFLTALHPSKPTELKDTKYSGICYVVW
jgi:hypothetical protein